MIPIGPELAAGIFLFTVVALFAALWMRGGFGGHVRKPSDDAPLGRVRQCPYCAAVVVDPGLGDKGKVMVCPVCKSYFEEDGR